MCIYISEINRYVYILRRICCISACCGGKIVIQASDIDGGEIPKGSVLQSRKPSKLRWRRFHISRCKKNDAKYQISRNKICLWLQKQDTYTLHKPVRYRFKRNRVIVGANDEQWEANLVIMDSLSKYNNGFNTF